MLHFTCDLCGQPLRKERFIARVEVYSAYDPEDLTEADLDEDNLAQVAQELDDCDEHDLQLTDGETRDFRFDLCPTCHRRYLKDPLGRDSLRRANFSQN